MWLKNFQFNNKTLSDVEMLVLSKISDAEFVEATTLIENLDHELPYWNVERGTIYPLLHRLTAQNLLEKSQKGKNLRFRRSEEATTFLSSLITSNGLQAQFDTTTTYLELLAKSMITVNPFAAEQFLDKFKIMIMDLQTNVDLLREKVQNQIQEDNWVNIDIE